MLGSNNLFVDEYHLAGECVPAGRYRETGTGREVELLEAGVLPASLDGRVATYICVRCTWHEHQKSHANEQRSARR